MQSLTLNAIKLESNEFLRHLSQQGIPSLFGATDGKAVGTFVEHGFRDHLQNNYDFEIGSSAKGIDFPQLEIDLKVTSARQPQSSCPFRSAEQKVYGLGYHLMVFVYDKQDDADSQMAFLHFVDAIFIDKSQTGDYLTTKGILDILERGANSEDIDGFLQERNLPLEEIGRRQLAERIISQPPQQGYITISNALQWRLQYSRAITMANTVNGIEKLLS